MVKEFNIKYYKAGSVALEDLTYVIIGAREGENWIFVRHSERKSWELPAGHIEPGESAEHAAERELFEETGTRLAKIRPLRDYSVTTNGSILYGRLFFADVRQRGPIPVSEIAEIRIAPSSPEPATYPDAHRSFLAVLEKYLVEPVQEDLET